MKIKTNVCGGQNFVDRFGLDLLQDEDATDSI